MPQVLYAYTVLFDVYCFAGDPIDALAAGAATGDLVMSASNHGGGLVANLYKPGQQETLLAPLHHVRMVAMNSTSMVIEGVVTTAQRNTLKSRTTSSTLRWVIKLPGAPAIVNTKKLAERSARRLAVSNASGFDARDDDYGTTPGQS